VKKATESDLVRACLGLLAMHGVFAWRANTTGIFDPGRKVFRSFQGMRGVSDILGLLDGGRFLAVEAKVPPNKPSIDQEYFLGLVRAKGGLAVVVYDLADLEKALALQGTT